MHWIRNILCYSCNIIIKVFKALNEPLIYAQSAFSIVSSSTDPEDVHFFDPNSKLFFEKLSRKKNTNESL